MRFSNWFQSLRQVIRNERNPRTRGYWESLSVPPSSQTPLPTLGSHVSVFSVSFMSQGCHHIHTHCECVCSIYINDSIAHFVSSFSLIY